MGFEDNPADERRILDEIEDQFNWVMANNANAKDAWHRARQYAKDDKYLFMSVVARLDSVIRDLKDQLGEALESLKDAKETP